jgi:glucose uptake protein GlcU
MYKISDIISGFIVFSDKNTKKEIIYNLGSVIIFIISFSLYLDRINLLITCNIVR